MESISLNINMDELAAAVARLMPLQRLPQMVERYGEAISKTQAARIINVSPDTITNMVSDGRLETCCEGSRIDVRSLANYIERKGEIDHRTRIERRNRKGR